MKIIQLLLISCLLTSVVSAQQIQMTGQRLNMLTSTIVDKSLEKYAVYQIDIAELAGEAGNRSQPFNLQIDLPGSASQTVALKPNKVVSDNYQLLIGTKNGVRIDYSKPKVSTFINAAGNDPEQEAALTFTENFVYGFFTSAGRTWFIEPLRYFDPEQPAGLFVVYERDDIKQGPDVACGAVELEKQKEENHPEEGDEGGTTTVNNCGPKVLEIAIANDFMMVEKYGSVAEVEAHNIALINAASVDWDNDLAAALIFEITAQFVPDSEEADPFDPAEDNRTVLLYALRDWANNGGFGSASFDYGKWRSPRKLINDQTPPQQVLGSTFSGQICSSYRYSVYSDYEGYELCTYKTIISHEMGHLFGAAHTPLEPLNIMSGAYVACTDTWSQVSKGQMAPLLTSATCLQPTSSSECVPPAFIPQPPEFVTIVSPFITCFTPEDPCIGGFEVTTDEPNLYISVTGRTICMVASSGFTWAHVFVRILDHCGQTQSKLPFIWYVSAVEGFTGELEDRSEDPAFENGLVVNAGSDFVYVNDNNANEPRQKTIQICDITGRTVISRISNDSRTEIPVGHLMPGIWVVRVNAGNEVVTKLFVR